MTTNIAAINDNNMTSINYLYLSYRDAGPTLALIAPALLFNLVGLLGVLLNGFVILTTVRSSSLRGPANLFMAQISAFEMVHQLGHLIFLAIAISGVNFISLRIASFLLAPSMFALAANWWSIFAAALDRLFAVASMNLHKRVYERFRIAYLGVHSFLCIAFASMLVVFVIQQCSKDAKSPTTGCIADLVIALETNIYFAFSTPLFISIFCYFLIAAFIFCNKNVTKETNMRLLRSLILILGVSVGGYLINMTIYVVLNKIDLGLSPIAIWESSFIFGTLLNIGAAANAPILYVNSTEYRSAFKSQLRSLCPRVCAALKIQLASSSVEPVNVSTAVRRNSLFPQQQQQNQQQTHRNNTNKIGPRMSLNV